MIMSVFHRWTMSRKTKTLVVALTAAAVAGLVGPVITHTQTEPSAQARTTGATAPNAASSVQGTHPDAHCYEVQVPVSVARIGKAHVYGELCVPRHGDKNG